MSYEKSDSAITKRLERERELGMKLLLERYCSDPALAVEKLVAAHADGDVEEYETIQRWLKTMDIEISITRPMYPYGNRKTGGRSQLGSSAHQAKLNEIAVKDIRASKRTPAELAREYDVSISTIRAVRNGRAWGHVE